MRFLRRIQGKIKKDRIRNETFRQELNMKPIQDKIVEGQLRWMGHVCRMKDDRLTKRVYETKGRNKNTRERASKTWNDRIREEVEKKDWNGEKCAIE